MHTHTLKSHTHEIQQKKRNEKKNTRVYTPHRQKKICSLLSIDFEQYLYSERCDFIHPFGVFFAQRKIYDHFKKNFSLIFINTCTRIVHKHFSRKKIERKTQTKMTKTEKECRL